MPERKVFVVVRKSDGAYLGAKTYGKSIPIWTDDFQKARIYNLRNHVTESLRQMSRDLDPDTVSVVACKVILED